MAISKAQIQATTKYVRDNYDRILFRLPKGHRDDIQAAAQAAGQSVNAYISQAVDERIQRDRDRQSQPQDQ